MFWKKRWFKKRLREWFDKNHNKVLLAIIGAMAVYIESNDQLVGTSVGKALSFLFKGLSALFAF